MGDAVDMSTRLLIATRSTYSRVRRLQRSGQIQRLRRAVYTTGAADSMIERIAAAALRLDAVASHETAATLWGMPTLGQVTDLHLTRERRCQGTTRSYEDVVLHHARLDPAHVTVHRGVALTTPERTAVDIARRRAFRAGVVAADAALRVRCSREQLLSVVDGCRRWPGIVQARRVVMFADPRAASPLESISRVAFHEYGLPSPILQAVIGGYEEVDFLWPEQRVVGEADGMSKYTTVEHLRREKVRQDGIAALGFAVARWTWPEVYRRPDALAHRMLEALVRNGYRPS